MRELVRVYVTDEKLLEWLKTKPEMSAFVVQTLQDLKDGKLVYLADSIDAKIKERRFEQMGLKNENLRLDNIIKEHTVTHLGVFGKPPSPEAASAIRQLAEHHAKEQNTTPPTKTISARAHSTLYLDRLGGIHAQCKYCDYSTIPSRDRQEQALDDIVPHLARHNEALT